VVDFVSPVVVSPVVVSLAVVSLAVVLPADKLFDVGVTKDVWILVALVSVPLKFQLQ
jgi:hypothetical protein